MWPILGPIQRIGPIVGHTASARVPPLRALLRLVDGGDYTCNDVRELGARHLEDVCTRRQDLQRLEGALTDLVRQCVGGATPDCSMLEALFAEPGVGKETASKSTTRTEREDRGAD